MSENDQLFILAQALADSLQLSCCSIEWRDCDGVGIAATRLPQRGSFTLA